MTRRKSKAEFTRWFGPLLDALRDLGDSGKPREVSAKIAENLQLQDKVLDEVLSRGQNKFHNQVAWARQYLVWEGLLDSSVRGTWKLTEKGKSASITEEQAGEICKKWVEINQKARKDTSKKEVIEGQENSSPEDFEISNDLLSILQSLSPLGFEKVCRELLREHGF